MFSLWSSEGRTFPLNVLKQTDGKSWLFPLEKTNFSLTNIFSIILRMHPLMFYLTVPVLLIVFVCSTQSFESLITISEMGREFSPIDENALLLGIYTYSTNKKCQETCHFNCFCRIFDYDSVSHRCRLFEGDLQTTGAIVNSDSSTSSVGQIEFSPNLFSAYGQSCSACLHSRYLTCVNGTCDCLRNTYWTGSICASQNLRGGQCTSANQCRADLNHTCLQFFQCGRKENIFEQMMSLTRFFSF